MPTFTLDDIDPVDRPDVSYQGESYPAAIPDDFDVETEARARRLVAQLSVLEGKPDNEAKAKSLTKMAGEILEIYFPTMPKALINKIPFMKKLELMRWWGQVVYPQRMGHLTEVLRDQSQGAPGNLRNTILGNSSQISPLSTRSR